MKKNITATISGIRLDTFLQGKLERMSRTSIQTLIKNGCVKVNGKTKTAHHIVKKDDIVEYEIPKPKKIKTHACKISLDIIYEDKNFLIVNKEAGISVHPTNISNENTLVDALIAHCGKNLSPIGGPIRPGIVHRLDKNTSGLLIVAKNAETHEYFQKLFHERKIEKTYLALIAEHIKPAKGSIEAPLTRSQKNRKRISVSPGKKARYALTHYEVIQTSPPDKSNTPVSLLRVRIVTGRTHQIRVHFSAIAHPIIGDETYGNARLNKIFAQKYDLKRQFLHAYRLSFKNPTTGNKQTFESPLPQDLTLIISSLF